MTVQLVGILNVTPDSFSDGGQFVVPEAAIEHAAQLFKDGAGWVDLGAESTRPGAVALTPDEEWRRLEPVLRVLLKEYPGKISLDTFHPETIDRAFVLGPVVVNDVTGLNNEQMVQTVLKHNATIIISHLPSNNIQAAHANPSATTVAQVKYDLLTKAARLEQAGLSRQKIILDPGIGFGKTMELNWELLRFANVVPNYAVMIGYSRKRFLGDKRMELGPNLKAGNIAMAAGARYLRVHDVAGHRALITR